MYTDLSTSGLTTALRFVPFRSLNPAMSFWYSLKRCLNLATASSSGWCSLAGLVGNWTCHASPLISRDTLVRDICMLSCESMVVSSLTTSMTCRCSGSRGFEAAGEVVISSAVAPSGCVVASCCLSFGPNDTSLTVPVCRCSHGLTCGSSDCRASFCRVLCVRRVCCCSDIQSSQIARPVLLISQSHWGT